MTIIAKFINLMPTIPNLIQEFLAQFPKDAPILTTRAELEEYMKELLEDYRKQNHQKQDSKTKKIK